MNLEFNIQATQRLRVERHEQYRSTLELPDHAFGTLAEVLQKLARVQSNADIELQTLRHLVFCSDHGIQDRLHRSSPVTHSTETQVQRLLDGHSPTAKACLLQQVDLTVIDCGVNTADELAPRDNLISQRIGLGTRDFTTMPALTDDQLLKAVKLGAEQVSIKMAEGAKVFSFGALGAGGTTSAAAITMALLNISKDIAMVNRNYEDASANFSKSEVLVQALELHRDHLVDGWQIVRHLGGFEIAATMGAIATAAELGGFCLVDGYACSSAVLALHALYPNITDYVQFTNQSLHLGQQAIMKHLGLRPLLNLNLGLGEGTGSILAWPMIETTVLCTQSFNPQ